MRNLADEARQFWSASTFWRRAPERDQTKAIQIIACLTKSLEKQIASRAQSLMKEMENEQRARND